jgi:hypothetical protein
LTNRFYYNIGEEIFNRALIRKRRFNETKPIAIFFVPLIGAGAGAVLFRPFCRTADRTKKSPRALFFQANIAYSFPVGSRYSIGL